MSFVNGRFIKDLKYYSWESGPTLFYSDWNDMFIKRYIEDRHLIYSGMSIYFEDIQSKTVLGKSQPKTIDSISSSPKARLYQRCCRRLDV